MGADAGCLGRAESFQRVAKVLTCRSTRSGSGESVAAPENEKPPEEKIFCCNPPHFLINAADQKIFCHSGPHNTLSRFGDFHDSSFDNVYNFQDFEFLIAEILEWENLMES